MFLVIEGQDSTRFHYLWCVQCRTLDLGHTCLQEQLVEIILKTFDSASKKLDKKEKKRRKNNLEWQLQNVWRYTQTQELEWQLQGILRYNQTQ